MFDYIPSPSFTHTTGMTHFLDNNECSPTFHGIHTKLFVSKKNGRTNSTKLGHDSHASGLLQPHLQDLYTTKLLKKFRQSFMINRPNTNVKMNNIKVIHDELYNTMVIFNCVCAWFVFMVAVFI